MLVVAFWPGPEPEHPELKMYVIRRFCLEIIEHYTLELNAKFSYGNVYLFGLGVSPLYLWL